MKNKKNPVPFLLILIILLITGRFLLFISYAESQKTVFRAELLQNQLLKTKTLRISPEDLFVNKNGMIWKENNRELLLDGIYHEVVALKHLDNVVLVCLAEDEEENRLFEKFFRLNTNKSPFLVELFKLLSAINFTHQASPSICLFSSPAIPYDQEQVLTLKNHSTELIRPPKNFFI